MSISKKIIAIFLTALFSAGLLSACDDGCYYTENRTVFSSGMVFSVSVLGGKGKDAIEEMVEFMDEIDASVNVNRNDSTLSKFNDAGAEEPVEIDEHAFTLVSTAKQLYNETDGAFNVALSPVSAAWGVDAAGINRYAYGGAVTQPKCLPDAETLEKLRQATDINEVECYEQDGKFFIVKHVDELKIDLGGIAKGYCADKCKEIAKQRNIKSALIKISGNVMLLGDFYDGNNDRAWGVGVINPNRETDSAPEYVCGFYIHGDKSVVTSGVYERRYKYFYGDDDCVKICHIIDGNTLLPVGVSVDGETGRYAQSEAYVTSATVIGENSMLADAYSTAVCVMGVKKGMEFLKEKGYEGIIFTSDFKYGIVGDLQLSDNEILYKTEYWRV